MLLSYDCLVPPGRHDFSVKIPLQNHLFFLAMMKERFALAENVISDIENISHRLIIAKPEMINEPAVTGIACLLFVCGNDDRFDLNAVCRLIAELWHKRNHREAQRVEIYLVPLQKIWLFYKTSEKHHKSNIYMP